MAQNIVGIMMSVKHFPKLPKYLVLALVGVLCIFVFLRSFSLNSLPVFVDEAIYVRWSQVMKSEPTLRFLPQSDGKQPLYMWLVIPMLKLSKDPLIAGRLVSIGAGFGSLVGIAVLGYLVSQSVWVSVLATFFYTLFPFSVFFDRMALADGLLAFFGVWSVVLGILFAQYKRLDLAMILGFCIGGALLTKSPGLFFLLLQPVLLLLVSKPKLKDFPKLIGGWLVAGLIAGVMYNILRLGPNFQLIGSRNQDYLFTFREVLTHPFNPLTGNIKNTIVWSSNLFTAVGVFLGLGALLWRKRTAVCLWLWVLAPLIGQALIAKVYTSRYFFFIVPVYAVLAALGLVFFWKKRRVFAYVLVAAFLVLALPYDWLLISDPAKSPMPQNMAHGYLQEWTAGWGQREAAAYLVERAKTNHVVVGTEGFFGTLPDGLQIYAERVPNLTVIGVGLNVSAMPKSLKDSLIENEVYLAINKTRHDLKEIPPERLKLISSFEKPLRPNGTREVFEFYQVLAP